MCGKAKVGGRRDRSSGSSTKGTRAESCRLCTKGTSSGTTEASGLTSGLTECIWLSCISAKEGWLLGWLGWPEGVARRTEPCGRLLLGLRLGAETAAAKGRCGVLLSTKCVAWGPEGWGWVRGCRLAETTRSWGGGTEEAGLRLLLRLTTECPSLSKAGGGLAALSVILDAEFLEKTVSAKARYQHG